MKTILLFMTILFFFLGCTKPEIEQSKMEGENSKLLNGFPVEVKIAYFEGWISGVRGGGSGINFFIELSEPLPKEVYLKSVFFRANKASLVPVSETLYVARFVNNVDTGDDLATNYDTYRTAISNAVSTSPIRDDQALLDYVINEEALQYLVSDVKEREPDFYPD